MHWKGVNTSCLSWLLCGVWPVKWQAAAAMKADVVRGSRTGVCLGLNPPGTAADRVMCLPAHKFVHNKTHVRVCRAHTVLLTCICTPLVLQRSLSEAVRHQQHHSISLWVLTETVVSVPGSMCTRRGACVSHTLVQTCTNHVAAAYRSCLQPQPLRVCFRLLYVFAGQVGWLCVHCLDVGRRARACWLHGVFQVEYCCHGTNLLQCVFADMCCVPFCMRFCMSSALLRMTCCACAYLSWTQPFSSLCPARSCGWCCQS